MIELTPYNIANLLSQTLGVFATYKFMHAFFDNRRVKKSTEILSYILYYLLSSFVALFFNIPILNLIVNLSLYFLLTFLYASSIKKKIFVSLVVYTVSMCAEMIVVTLTGYINFPLTEVNNYDSIFGIVATNGVLFAMSMAASGFKNIKTGNILPKAFWIALVTVPALSLYMLVVFFRFKGLTVYDITSFVAAILIINFMVFFLFDRVSLLYKERQESALIKQQNEYYVNQLLLVEDLHNETGKLRHDIKNHLLTINSYLEDGDTDEAKKHISSIIGIYQNKAEIVHTGFPAVDGLLNAKLQPAAELGVKINVKVSLPSEFSFPSFDLTIILGNLIDNALQAVSLVDENKFIDFGMDYSKGMLIIKVANSFKTAVQKENGKIVSSKPDREKHGYGLRNVNEVLERYNGTSEINIRDAVFTITVALYTE